VRQQDYENIVACIQFGAPALSSDLLRSLNSTVENSNNWIQAQKRSLEQAQDVPNAKSNKPPKQTE